MGGINLDFIGKAIDMMVGVIAAVANFAGGLGIWLVIIIFGFILIRKLRNR